MPTFNDGRRNEKLKSPSPIVLGNMVTARDFVALRLGFPWWDLSLPNIVESTETLNHILTLMSAPVGSVAALYIPGTIVFPDEFDMERSGHHLVHEMTHHAQLVKRMRHPHPKDAERLAYELQNQYAALRGWTNRIGSQRFIEEMTR